MNNKADMPNWNKFVNEVLSGKYKGSEKKLMRIICNMDRTQYKKKPDSEQIRKIQCNLERPQEIEVQDLFRLICSGASFRSAAINGKSDSGFVSQSLFAVDIDNAVQGEQLTPEQAIDRARTAGLTPNFIYPTFSDSPTLRKYRILFLLDIPIIEHELRDRIADYVINVFGNAADSKCRNPSRLFFGTNKPPILTDTDHINHIADIERLLPATKEPQEKTPKDRQRARKRGTLYHKPQNPHSISNIELIRAGNVEELKRRLGNKKAKVFNNSEEFLKYIYSELDIAELLEVDTPNHFCCIFHDDRHPSASIFKDRYGNQRYSCRGCDVSMNTKQVIEALMDAKSEYRVFEFIKAIYNLKIKETAWSMEQKANIDSIISCMTSTAGNGFSEICPTAAKTTRNATLIYLQILNIARNTIFPESIGENEGNIIFTMSIRQLAKAAGKSSIDKVSKYLKMLIYHEMIEIVPDSKIPQDLLNRANAKRTGEKHCHTNFYRIPSWVYRQTRLIEAQGERWKKQNYRLNGISYELFFRNEGAEVAKKLFPQTATYTTKTGEEEQRTPTEESNEATLFLSEILLWQIQQSGYTTEADVIKKAASKTGYKMADIQLKRSINEILENYGLKKIRANKAIKEQYGITSKGYPFIITK